MTVSPDAGHAELNGVQIGTLGGEAEVLRSIGLRFGVVEGSWLDESWALAKDLPRACAIDSVAIDLEPLSDG